VDNNRIPKQALISFPENENKESVEDLGSPRVTHCHSSPCQTCKISRWHGTTWRRGRRGRSPWKRCVVQCASARGRTKV